MFDNAIKIFSAFLTDRYVETNPLYHLPLTIDGIQWKYDMMLDDFVPSAMHIIKAATAGTSMLFEDFKDVIWDVDITSLQKDYPPAPGLFVEGRSRSATMELIPEPMPGTKSAINYHIKIHIYD